MVPVVADRLIRPTSASVAAYSFYEALWELYHHGDKPRIRWAGAGWAYEIKHDGLWLIYWREGGRVRVLSRRLITFFPGEPR